MAKIYFNTRDDLTAIDVNDIVVIREKSSPYAKVACPSTNPALSYRKPENSWRERENILILRRKIKAMIWKPRI